MTDKDFPIILIIVGTYAVVITILLLGLAILYCRRSKKCQNCSSHEPEDLKTLTRRSVGNEYRILSSSSSTDRRSHSLSGISNVANRMSEYDSFACTSKSHESVAFRSDGHDVSNSRDAPSLNHHYEEITSDKDRNQLDFIVKQVTDILCSLGEKVRERQMGEQFVKILMHNIRAQNSNLYECFLKNQDYLSKHQYEIIQESNKSVMTKMDDDDDDNTYVKYVNPPNAPLQQKSKSLGVSDHLQYLRESKKNLLNVPDKDDYMEPKRFSARSQCPEDLRLLSEQNMYDSACVLPECDRCPDQRSAAENIEERNPSTHHLSRTLSNSRSRTKSTSLSFRIKAQEVEKALTLRPKLPPKKSRTLSEEDREAGTGSEYF